MRRDVPQSRRLASRQHIASIPSLPPILVDNDVVHFALNELKHEFMNGREEEVIERLRDHVVQNKVQRQPPHPS